MSALRLAESLRQAGAGEARVAVVLGSGLGAFAESLEGARAIGFEDLPDMPRGSVPGHAGRFVVGRIGGVRVVTQQGRVHLYEGRTVEEVTRSVRALALLGCRALVLTNAAGGLREDWPPGTLMRVTDHLNLQGESPLARAQGGRGSPYDAALGLELERAASAADVPLERGVYAGLPGPSYETPAEIRMLRGMGADAVGMSTVCEALAAHGEGLRVAAVSCITNLAAGIGSEPLSHEEVLETGREAAGRFERLLRAAVPRLAAES